MKIVGKVKHESLSKYRPNDWNPNALSPFQRSSLRQGLLDDGWLSSHALLVWGTDDKGAPQNVIIDGEHRWREAVALGFAEAPVVALDGLTRAEAIALTVKLDAKRGQFNHDLLASVVREVSAADPGASPARLSLSLGVEEGDLLSMLAPVVDPSDDGAPLADQAGAVPSGMAAHVRMVQVFFKDQSALDDFTRTVKELSGAFKTKDVTTTVLEAMRRACRPAP